MNKKRLIVGLGNILLKDDGAGVRCVEYLRNIAQCRDARILDGATMGLDLLEEIREFERVVIVDAVDMERNRVT